MVYDPEKLRTIIRIDLSFFGCEGSTADGSVFPVRLLEGPGELFQEMPGNGGCYIPMP